MIVVCFIASIAAAYIHALQPKYNAADEAFNRAQAEANIETMDDFYSYNGKEAYSVVVGSTSDGTKKVVWLPDAKDEQVWIEDYHTGKSKEDILAIVEKESNPKEIISIKLGMENNVPLWEVTYLDDSDLYNYNYYDFKTGQWLKYYRSI